MIKIFNFLLLIALSVPVLNISQIRLKEIPPSKLLSADTIYFNNNSIRKTLNFGEGWTVYAKENSPEKLDVNLPCFFEDTKSLFFEKKFESSSALISEYNLNLVFLGINYSAEILLNDVIIFKNDAGNIPIKINLSAELLKTSEPNIIKVKINHELDSRSTIPVQQRFLFPKNLGGILRDVYLELIPKSHIASLGLLNVSSSSKDFSSLEYNLKFERDKADTTSAEFFTRVNIYDLNGKSVYNGNNVKLYFGDQKSASVKLNYQIPVHFLWHPDNPNYLYSEVTLLRDGEIVDIKTQYHSALFLTKEYGAIKLNGEVFEFKGVTYIISADDQPLKNEIDILRSDLGLIKELGFNTVRFAKAAPHPYALHLCQQLGLFAFIEMPLNSIPDEIINNEVFVNRAGLLFDKFLEQYSEFSLVAAIGIGGGFIDSEIQKQFISNLSSRIKIYSNKLSFASFSLMPHNKIEFLDLYGIEIFSDEVEKVEDILKESASNLGRENIFLSEVTYPHYNSEGSGYLSRFSREAQAKYFEDMLNLFKEEKVAGFFINSILDYSGDYPSFYSKFSANNLYKIGIVDEERNKNSITYNVIQSKLSNSERVTIPIGTKADDFPLFIIFTGLALAIVMGLLINSKKKFREDSMRALLRPYNFFADIRDHRILSGFHTFILMLVLSGAHSLLLTNLLYYFKDKILLERLILASGLQTLASAASYLAWNPVQCFFYLWIITIFTFVFVSLIIKFGSLFIKTKVSLLNIFFIVIWSFLPLAVILPVKLILYRVLAADIINLYIFMLLGLYALWILQRIIKGVYVIFDISKIRVYFYSILLIIIAAGSLAFYFQNNYSTVYYFLNTLKQFKII